MRMLTRRFNLSAAALLLGAAAVALPAVAAPGSAAAAPRAAAATGTPIQIYGAWHCSNDACLWGSVRTIADFDANNHWLIDRGDGKPSVNLVVLSFVNPLRLLNGTNDSGDANGVPVGMTSTIVNYFTSHGIRVMLSIGGITYTNDWDTALAQNGTLLGQKAAALATQLGVGIEIDYENGNSPNLTGLQAFVTAYRAAHPYDATGADPTARLTIDVAAGDRWLVGLDQYATANWLKTSSPVLDYANAMVPSKQPSASSAESNWLEHVDGKPTYSPPIPPLAPAKFTGSLFISEGNTVRPECTNFASSVQNASSSWVESVAPAGAGTTAGMLGYMFWAADVSSTRGVNTDPPNTCLGGVGVGSTALSVPIPMPALRQQ
ncbi:MAG TPA: glycoside hydrolase family 18 protein [Actinocrinis sp.]|uniref:glycoside hydrolase family 18 protein n=1 Tax=Actinocrinis sp. TaxID=1920516 RepID=UPI002DDCFC5D|nr:glycoside hydrolase family 18 protein [Actinocrinis sp.]HEV2343932.1 glycoside hydrolase family 18 protein [Actinocrinis sp.]